MQEKTKKKEGKKERKKEREREGERKKEEKINKSLKVCQESQEKTNCSRPENGNRRKKENTQLKKSQKWKINVNEQELQIQASPTIQEWINVPQMDGRTDRQIDTHIYICNIVLFNYKKEYNSDTLHVDGT